MGFTFCGIGIACGPVSLSQRNIRRCAPGCFGFFAFRRRPSVVIPRVSTHCPNAAGPIRQNLAWFVWPGWGCFPATSVRGLLFLCLPFPKGILWAPLGFPLKTRHLGSKFFFACGALCRGCYPATFRPRYISRGGMGVKISQRE